MSERYEPYREPYRQPDDWSADQGSRDEPDDWREHTTPNMAAVPPLPASGHTTGHPAVGGRGYPDQGYQAHGYPDQGYPAHGYPAQNYPGEGTAGPAYPGDRYAGAPGTATAPDYTGRPVAFRRPDALAGLLLVLAGVAAGVSLLLHWVHASDVTGWDLIRSAWHQLRTTPSALADSGLWQPAAAVAGGVLLFVLGLLMFVPARTHRTLGLLALLVSIGAGAGLLVALSGAGWHVGRFQTGFWVAVAVPVLGLIGALKALVTGPRLGNRTPSAY
jgi:hypothetical protein